MTSIAPHSPALPHRHAALDGRRRFLPVLLLLLVLAIGLAAAATAVRLHHDDAPDPVGTALDRFAAWPAASLDGYLTGSAPTRLRATVAADGAAHGVVGRVLNGRAEFAVGPHGTLVRGNRQWWCDEPPLVAATLADHWVPGPRDGAVAQFTRGRLTPAALSRAVSAVRDPDGRETAHVVVDGVPGTSYSRGSIRLVVDERGDVLALSVPAPGVSAGDASAPVLSGTGAPAPVRLAFRAGPGLSTGDAAAAGDGGSWGVLLTVRPADPAAVAAT